METGRLIKRARKLGCEYLDTYKGCAQTTLLAVADALGMDVDDELFKAILGFSGETGGCGGICGATAAIGLRYGLKKEDFERNPGSRFKIYDVVKKVKDRFDEAYGSYLCKDIQMKLFGRTFESTNPEDQKAFEELDLFKDCSKVTENAAGWTVEAILEADRLDC